MATGKATFYWHDYETWGLNPALDRPSQFAGIRTDMDFNVIAKPDMFYCQLSDDYLPSIESVLITQIIPDKVQAEGVTEVEFSQRIQQQFSQSKTCIVGYNNIRFDDEFTRYLLYRNFYDPYEYSWKNSNSRWDIIDLVRAAYALRPDGIIWPKNEEGFTTFRLELLTKANGISHEQAHDALSDVYATIAMAKLIKQKCPKLFDYYFELRNKNKVKELLNIDKHTPLVHVSGMFGAKRSNVSLIAPIAWHPVNNNAVIVVDLAKDLSPLLSLSADEIRVRLYTKHDELGDCLPIPLKLVHINKCPFLAIPKTLTAENAQRAGLDKTVCFDNVNLLQQNPQVAAVVLEVFQQEREFEHNDNVDTQLYSGFFSTEAKNVFRQIQTSSPDKLAHLDILVSDKRFKTLLFRYRARNFPDSLSREEQQQWQAYKKTVFEPIQADYLSHLEDYAKKYQDDAKTCLLIQQLKAYVLTLLERSDIL